MRHPCKHFIKYFLLASNEPITSIEKELTYLGLPPLTEDSRDGLKQFATQVRASVPPDADLETLNAPAVKFLRKEQVLDIFRNDRDMRLANQLLDHGQARRDAFIWLLGRANPVDLVKHIKEKYDIDLTLNSIKSFKHYYYDVDSISRAEWAEIFVCLEKTDETDFAASLIGGASVAAYKLGVEHKITIKEVMTSAVLALHATQEEIRSWPATMEKVKALSEITNALTRAHAVMTSAHEEIAEVAKELRTLKLKGGKEKPISLKILSGGNHSGVERETSAG